MRKFTFCLLAVLWLSALVANQGRPDQTDTATYTAKVIRIADGDTVTVQTKDYEQIKIRLYGIDAPESDQPGGAEAKAALDTLYGQKIKIKPLDEDRYGRSVALIEFKGQSVNLSLVSQGLAWHYVKYCKAQPICGHIKAAEAEAREAKRGLWSGNPMPPWDWRHKK